MLVVKNARVATMRAAQGLPGDGPLALLEGGAVACEGERIVYVGPSSVAPAGEEIDARGRLVTPGLVDPHTHCVFAGDRAREHAQRIAGVSYLEIGRQGGGIRSTVRATRAASDEQLLLSTTARLSRMLASGVTTVEVKTGYGLSLADELRLLRLALLAGDESGCEVVPTLLGLHAVPEEVARDAWLARVCGELLPEAVAAGAAGCDAFCEEGAFTAAECRTFLRAGMERGLVGHLHADQLTDSGGAGLAAEIGCASADHLERASMAGIAAMARAGTAAVLLPLAAWFLRQTPARAAPFLEAGVAVALGSNLNPGSQRIESVSLLLAAGCLFCGLSPAQALWACTAGAAQALRLSDRGVLENGKRADLVVWDCDDAAHLPYHAGIEHAQVVIARGKLAHQDIEICLSP
jgi:imidazolonepropionase